MFSTTSSFISGPIPFWGVTLLTAAVGVVALVAAGRAPSMRVLIRVAGVLLILRAVSSIGLYTLSQSSQAVADLGTVWNIGIVVITISALVLLIIAVAFGRAGGQRPGTPPPPGHAPPPPPPPPHR